MAERACCSLTVEHGSLDAGHRLPHARGVSDMISPTQEGLLLAFMAGHDDHSNTGDGRCSLVDTRNALSPARNWSWRRQGTASQHTARPQC